MLHDAGDLGVGVVASHPGVVVVVDVGDGRKAAHACRADCSAAVVVGGVEPAVPRGPVGKVMPWSFRQLR